MLDRDLQHVYLGLQSQYLRVTPPRLVPNVQQRALSHPPSNAFIITNSTSTSSSSSIIIVVVIIIIIFFFLLLMLMLMLTVSGIAIGLGNASVERLVDLLG